MKFTIDIDQIINWCKKHLKFVIPSGLIFLSWFFGHNADGHGFIPVWYGFMSVISGITGIVTFIRVLTELYD